MSQRIPDVLRQLTTAELLKLLAIHIPLQQKGLAIKALRKKFRFEIGKKQAAIWPWLISRPAAYNTFQGIGYR